jgi:hypothetical protein
MGFKPWCKLSVLLLAGVALVGCNNGAEKDKKVLGPTGLNSPTNGALSNPNRDPFPTKDNLITPIGGVSQQNKASDPTFGIPANPNSGIPKPPLGLLPMAREPSFTPPANPAVPMGGGSSNLLPLGSSGSNSAPSVTAPMPSGFATVRESSLAIPMPGSGQIAPIPTPDDFLKR